MDRLYEYLQPDEKKSLRSLSMLAGKWQPVILIVLTRIEKPGFTDIEAAVPDISGKVLTETLQTLQERELVERTVVNESPLRVEYELTPAGSELTELFDPLAAWGDRHLETVTSTVLVAGTDDRVTEMYARWLAEQYTVRTVCNGRQLRENLDEVDLVLFDQHLPEIDPGLVHSIVPSDCWTILLTDEQPPFRVLDIPCDTILCKPLVRSTLLERVDRQLSREQTTDRTFEALLRKKQLFERSYDAQALAASDRYTRVKNELAALSETD